MVELAHSTALFLPILALSSLILKKNFILSSSEGATAYNSLYHRQCKPTIAMFEPRLHMHINQCGWSSEYYSTCAWDVCALLYAGLGHNVPSGFGIHSIDFLCPCVAISCVYAASIGPHDLMLLHGMSWEAKALTMPTTSTWDLFEAW